MPIAQGLQGKRLLGSSAFQQEEIQQGDLVSRGPLFSFLSSVMSSAWFWDS